MSIKFTTMNHYQLDYERYHRQGFPEVIYTPGKTIKQVINIVKELSKAGQPVICTRADRKTYLAVKKKFKQAKYYQQARIIAIRKRPNHLVTCSLNHYVCVITAGTSDIPVAEECAVTCQLLGTKVEKIYDVGVAGVHRLFKHIDKITKSSCVVVCAGMEGALPSIVGGLVSCPVVGVPTSVGYGANFGGISALLTMLNSCAPNISVVNIDDGFGAGVIAHLICKIRD